MNEHNERMLKTVLCDIRNENDALLKQEIEDAKNDPRFAVTDEEAIAFAKKYAKKKQKFNAGTFAKVAAVIVVLAVVVSFVVPVSVQGQKCSAAEIVLNYICSEFMIFGTDKAGDSVSDYHGEFVPAYIPEGYYVHSVSNSKSNNNIYLVNSVGNTISISESSLDARAFYSNEDGAKIEDVTISGYNGKLITYQDYRSLILFTENCVLDVLVTDNKIDIVDFVSKFEKK